MSKTREDRPARGRRRTNPQCRSPSPSARGENYRIIKLRFEGGVASEVDLDQAKSDYEYALSTIPQFEKQIAQQENALSVLLGRNPGPIMRDRTLDKLVLPEVPYRGVEQLFRLGRQGALRAGRHARRRPRPRTGHPHLHLDQAALGRAAPRRQKSDKYQHEHPLGRF